MSEIADGCAYCREVAAYDCDACGCRVCAEHGRKVVDVAGDPDVVLCRPDPGTWPGRGCYRPPVAEVAP